MNKKPLYILISIDPDNGEKTPVFASFALNQTKLHLFSLYKEYYGEVENIDIKKLSMKEKITKAEELIANGDYEIIDINSYKL